MIKIPEAWEHFEGKLEQLLPSIGEKFAFLDRERKNSYFVTSGEKWAFSDSFFCLEGGFFLPRVHFSLPDDFFLTRNDKRAKWIQGGKILPKNRKKEYEKQAHFRNEGQKVLYSRVVYNEGFGFIRKSLYSKIAF